MAVQDDPRFDTTAQAAKDTERGFEIGKDESYFNAVLEKVLMSFANVKRTYDAYQDLDLGLARRELQDTEAINNVRLQALQNAVESANMVAKQAIRHSDFAVDQWWNTEPSEGAAENVVLGAPQTEALRSIVASVLAKDLSS